MSERKKALVVTTVASTIDQFCMNDILLLHSVYDVQVAANFSTGNNTSKERITEFKIELINKHIVINEIEFDRNPFCKNNLLAYKKIKSIMEQNNFNLIHCHTPIAAMLTRLAAKELRDTGCKVIYTAHGFHFYKGAPIINWLIYYPIEKWLAKYTDTLVTINKEDYERAKSKFKAKKIIYIPGVGIDLSKFNLVKIDKDSKRREMGLPIESFVVLSVGELNKNKNHEVIIKALSRTNNDKIHYVISGQGQLDGYLRSLSKELGVEKQVHLLGFRNDIAEICKASDLFLFPSFREGLSVALMEAMACGLPIICSNIRGNRDLIEDNRGGYLVESNNVNEFAEKIRLLYEDQNKKEKMGLYNLHSIKKYELKNVLKEITKIYYGSDDSR